MREIIRQNIKVGRTAAETLEILNGKVRDAGFAIMKTFNKPTEFFAYTPAPEWGGKKVRIPLEDDAVVTHNGIEWLYPINTRILLIR